MELENFNLDKQTKKTVVMLVLNVLLGAAAFFFGLINYSVGELPSFCGVHLAYIPELLGSLLYGPFSGMFVILVKNFISLWALKYSVVDIATNIVVEFAFVVPATLIYHSMRSAVKKTDENGEKYYIHKSRRKRIIIASLLSTVIAIAVMYFFEVYFSVPFLVRTNAVESLDFFIKWYQTLIPSVSTVGDAVLMFNVPINAVAMVVTTIVVAYIYKPLKRAIHDFIY